jgi:tetratricopeptide (TPR) repeat protein
MYRDTNRSAEAAEAYQKVIALREPLARNYPQDADYQERLTRGYNNLGLIYEANRRFDLAEQAFQKVIAIREQLTRDHPELPEYQLVLARALLNLSSTYSATSRPDLAEATLHRAEQLLQQLVHDHPKESDYRDELARYQIKLAFHYGKMGQFDQAEGVYQKALELWQAMAKAHPTLSAYPVLIGRTFGNLGYLARDRGRPEAALPLYAQAIGTLQKVLEQDAKDASARFYLNQTHAGRALALSALQRHAEALADWNRVVELADERNRAPARGERALTWARLGQRARATAEANELAGQPKVTGETLYLAARAHAVAAGSVNQDSALSRQEQETLTEQYAARAVGLLARSQEMGYFKDPAHGDDLEKNADFAALRARSDFPKLPPAKPEK